MVNFVLGLTIIIGIATVLALFARLIKQPPIIAYLVAGLLVGPLFFNLTNYTSFVEEFAHLGISLLLFIAGLHLDFRSLKRFWKVSLVIGIGQLIITFILGFFIAKYFGYSPLTSWYIGMALAFSSTVVISLLSKNSLDPDTIHGRITTGILIVQDLIAALTLIILPIVGSGAKFSINDIAMHLVKGSFLIGVVFLFSYIVLSGILHIASKNQEILLLFGVAWALLIASVFNMLNLSLEVGALIAGMTLASSKFSLEIGNRIKPLRDFFVVIFFVFFGSLVIGPFSSNFYWQIIAFSLLVLIGNTIVVMVFMKFFGYKKRTGFLTGITVAQISEFSLVLVFIGFSIGALNREVLSLIILIGLVTMALSSYFIYYSNYIFNKFSPFLGIFDGNKKEKSLTHKRDYEIILFGYNRLGFNILQALENSKKKYLVVDFNPEVIDLLVKKKINCIYGDANDVDLLSELKMENTKMIISTIPDEETNLLILSKIKNKDTIFIPTSHRIADTRKLYELGASYVIMPHFLGGEYVYNLLNHTELDKKKIEKEGQKHRKDLFERIQLGQEHPQKDLHGK